MVHVNELSQEDGFVCPACGFPLSLLRRELKRNGNLVVLVTCEDCDEFNGFVVDLGVQEADLEAYIGYNGVEHRAVVSGYE